jgi:hypothetical protein
VERKSLPALPGGVAHEGTAAAGGAFPEGKDGDVMSAFLAAAFGVVLAMSAQFTFAMLFQHGGSPAWGIALIAVGVVAALARVRLGQTVREISEPANLAIASAMTALFWIGLPVLRWLLVGLVAVSTASAALLVIARERRPMLVSLFEPDAPEKRPSTLAASVGAFVRRIAAATWNLLTSATLLFVLDFFVVVPFVLGADDPDAAARLVAPWLVFVFGPLHLLFLAVAFGRFDQDWQLHRNRMLERATIVFLRDAGLSRVGGHAETTGFQIHGRGASPRAIQNAFGHVTQLIRRDEPLPDVSPRGRSHPLTTGVFGLVLLVLVVQVAFLLVTPRLDGIVLLIGVAVLYFTLREDIGRWVQDWIFRATELKGTSIRGIRRIKPHVGETAPAFFVQTGGTHLR